MTPTQRHLYEIFDLDRYALPLTWVIHQTEDRKSLDLRKPQPNPKIIGKLGLG